MSDSYWEFGEEYGDADAIAKAQSYPAFSGTYIEAAGWYSEDEIWVVTYSGARDAFQLRVMNDSLMFYEEEFYSLEEVEQEICRITNR